MFIRKNLVSELYSNRRNRVLKWFILFFLWASATLLATHADVQINTNITNAVSYIKRIVLTLDGSANTATGIILDGALWQVQTNKYCDLSGSNCIIPGKSQYLNIGYSLTIPAATLQCSSCDTTPSQDCGTSFYTVDYANNKCYDVISNGYMIYEKNWVEKDPIWAVESGNYVKKADLLTTIYSLASCISGQVLKATDTSFVCSN